jgi:NADPH2:quinone reductase
MAGSDGCGVAGQRVLVAGGAGAVGHYAVQFARLMGAAQVIATTSTAEKAALARAAGADLTIDYRQPEAAARVREATQGQGVDRVVELDIAANAAFDLDVLRPGGDLVVYGSGASPFELPFFPLIAKNLNLRFFIVYHLALADRQRCEAALGGWLQRGALQHNIAQRLPLARIAEAHDAVAMGRVAGNLVLSIP